MMKSARLWVVLFASAAIVGLWLAFFMSTTVDMPRGAAVPLDDGVTVRVMVVYSATDCLIEGVSKPIAECIPYVIDKTNQSFLDSGIAPDELNLVLAGTREVEYTETGDLGADLVSLRAASDGFIDEVHSWREDDYADLVSLVVSDGDRCYASDPISDYVNPDPSHAFSVIRSDCLIDKLGFPMALGENMGARLDWFNNDSSVPRSYSHGLIYIPGPSDPPVGWRTVMSLDSPQTGLCTVKEVECDHLWRWSTPLQDYAPGQPLGFPEGTGTNCTMGVDNNPDCDADNVRVLEETTSLVANFRSGPPPTPTLTPTITPTPRVLLVNDEGLETPEVEHYYIEPLQTLQVPFATKQTGEFGQVEPSNTELAPYQAVIWFTGRNISEYSGPAPTPAAELKAWLQDENCLLISSSDLHLPGGMPSAFMQETLGVLSISKDVTQTIVSGVGPYSGLVDLPLLAPAEYPSADWNSTDSLVPQPDTSVAFQGDKGPAGLFKMMPNYRTSYLAFPLEMLPSDSDRVALLGRFLATCDLFESLFLPVVIAP